jgi:molybdopterin-guanine dinucleotide biosynthesis protein A
VPEGPRPAIAGAILAGGRAARLGGIPKGLLRVGGERIIDRVARALREVSSELLLVANDQSAGDWLTDVRITADLLPTGASLVGIHAALSGAGRDCLVVAWDMPFVPSSLLREMAERLAAGARAVIPSGLNGPEPVCAAYSLGTIPDIERMAEAGRFTLARMIESLPGAEIMTADEVRAHGDPGVIFLNVNTPADLERAEAAALLL